MKFNKVFNAKIIVVAVSVLSLFNSTVYPSLSKDSLRVPMNQKDLYERMGDVYTAVRTFIDKGSDIIREYKQEMERRSVSSYEVDTYLSYLRGAVPDYMGGSYSMKEANGYNLIYEIAEKHGVKAEIIPPDIWKRVILEEKEEPNPIKTLRLLYSESNEEMDREIPVNEIFKERMESDFITEEMARLEINKLMETGFIEIGGEGFCKLTDFAKKVKSTLHIDYIDSLEEVFRQIEDLSKLEGKIVYFPSYVLDYSSNDFKLALSELGNTNFPIVTVRDVKEKEKVVKLLQNMGILNCDVQMIKETDLRVPGYDIKKVLGFPSVGCLVKTPQDYIKPTPLLSEASKLYHIIRSLDTLKVSSVSISRDKLEDKDRESISIFIARDILFSPAGFVNSWGQFGQPKIHILTQNPEEEIAVKKLVESGLIPKEVITISTTDLDKYKDFAENSINRSVRLIGFKESMPENLPNYIWKLQFEPLKKRELLNWDRPFVFLLYELNIDIYGPGYRGSFMRDLADELIPRGIKHYSFKNNTISDIHVGVKFPRVSEEIGRYRSFRETTSSI